jgi:hypothetical protein
MVVFVVERVDDHFEFAVAIQIKDSRGLVHVRGNRLIRLLVNLTGRAQPQTKSQGQKSVETKYTGLVSKL